MTVPQPFGRLGSRGSPRLAANVEALFETPAQTFKVLLYDVSRHGVRILDTLSLPDREVVATAILGIVFFIEWPGLADLQHLLGDTTAEVTLTTSKAEGVPPAGGVPGIP